MLRGSSGTTSTDDANSANATTVSYDELVPERDLARGQIHGRLKLLFKQRPDQLDFAVKAKLTTASSYVQGSKQRRTVMVRFVLLPYPAGDGAGAAMDSDYALLRQSLGSAITVDCTGARVVSRRTMGDGVMEVMLRATGTRLATINSTAHDLLSTCTDPPPLTSVHPKWPRVVIALMHCIRLTLAFRIRTSQACKPITRCRRLVLTIAGTRTSTTSTTSTCDTPSGRLPRVDAS